jgi:serine/threonine-protein kinase
MYELLCGTPPFVASTSDELARLHISARPIPIREYIPDIPTALEEIIMKVLSKEPAARYRTADQLGRVLLKFGTQPDAPAPTPVPVQAPVIAVSPEISDKLPTRDSPPLREVTAPRQYTQPAPAPQDVPEPDAAFEEIDWVFWGLALFAVLTVGGLIPFWMMVYFAYNPPVR